MKTIANSQFFRTAFEKWAAGFAQRHPEAQAVKFTVKPSLEPESFHLSLQEDGTHIDSGSAAAALQGAGLWEPAFASGDWADYIGAHQAAYPCRWLHIQEKYDAEYLCKRLLQMGYNGALFEEVPENRGIFKEMGIALVLLAKKPDATPFDTEWQPDLENLDGVDAVYWKGSYTSENYRNHPNARDDLMIDLALKEVQAVEEAIRGRCPLVYELDPDGPVHLIPELMDSVGNQTMISFSALNGKPTDDHLDYHPLWKLLRELPDTSATRLLPILNIGGVEQGEGFWPVIPLDLIDFVITHMRRQPFGGAVVMTNYLSKTGTLLDGALWTAGHSLWGSLPPRLLLETWCKAFHPSLSSLELLGDIWKVSRRLSGLHAVGERTTEEYRMLSESLIGELNRLHGVVESYDDSRTPSIKEYFTYFARDARRLVLHFLQTRHAPMVNVLNGDDLQESFWTVIQQSGRPGIGSGAKVSVLKTPQAGSEGSAMRQIYEEVSGKESF